MPTLHRSQVLLTLGLHDYCELQTDRCLVHHDNELWSPSDPSAHNIEHGAYIRVEVPPPHDDNLDTDIAIAISREFSLPSASTATVGDCDHTSMFQMAAHICQYKVASQDVQSPPLLSRLGLDQHAHRPRHRRVQFAGDDFFNFERSFLAHSFVECEEEGHVAYIDTWFIHHRNHPTCRASRAVRLHEDPAEWLHDIIEPWEDLLQAQEDVLLHLVRPPPPCSHFGCTLAHVIVEQSSRPEFVPGMVSILDFDDVPSIPSHSAYPMPNLLNHNAVLRLADALFACRSRHCRVLLGALPFGLYDFEFIQGGTGLVIHLQARHPQEPDLSDDSTLLQTQYAAKSLGTQCHFEIGSRQPMDHFIDESPACNSNSIEMRRQVPPLLQLDGLQAMPPFVQELFMHWLSHAHAMRAQAQHSPAEPSMMITTWYLAMPQYPGCDASRPVLLRQDFQQWLQTIIEAWHDVIDASLPFFVHLVRPQPPVVVLDNQHTIHVLVVQNPPADGVANLFTIVEPNHVLQPLRNMARFAPTPISHSQAIGFAGLADACYFNVAPMLCSLWHGTFEIRDRIALQNRHGYGFVFHIQEAPRSPTPNFWEEDDDNTLLQYPSLSGRCQTAGQVAHTQRPSADMAPQTMCLSDLISTPPKITVDFTTVEQLAREISAAHNHFQQDWPSSFTLPEVTQHALDDLTVLSAHPPRALHFYTDGSKVSDGAVGAGVVLLFEYSDAFAYGGAICKVIQEDGQANLGENGAVIWALIWAVQMSNHYWQYPLCHDLHFFFHFDSINAGFLAGGYFRTKEFPQLRILMRSLAQILQGRHGLSNLHWLHVRAHNGDPWNEFADALAKFASQHPDEIDHSDLWWSWTQNQHHLRDLQWIWFLEQMWLSSPSTPCLREGFLECLLHPLHDHGLHNAGLSQDTSPREEPAIPVPPVLIDMTIATANILTLQQPSTSRPGVGSSITRQSILMQQFHAKGCHIVGVQETRHKHIVGGNNPWYHIVGHPATPQGTDGIQLWISKCHPLYAKGPLLQRNHIQLVASRADYIIAKLVTEEWKCVIVTGRAPHSGKPLLEARAYWAEINQAIHRKAAGWPVLYCGDSNGHLGTSTTSAVGCLSPSIENQAGTVFHDWLLQQRMFVPATFDTMHRGDQHSTFHAPDAEISTRIDYLALPQELNYQLVSTWVDLDIDISLQRLDHSAVLCHCQFAVAPPSKRAVLPPQRWDSHHLQHHLQREDVVHQLHHHLPAVPWHVDPHSSAACLTHHVTQALHSIAHHRKQWRRKSHISATTWNLVDMKKQLFKELRSLKRTRLHTILHACFSSWRAQLHDQPQQSFLALLRGLPGWIALHDGATALTLSQYQQATMRASHAIRQEDAHYYQQLADQTATTYSHEGLTGVWKHLRAILPKNRGKFNQIQQDLGPQLLQHFQDLEAGCSIERQQLFSQCLHRNNRELSVRPRSHQMALDELPTLAEIENHCLRQQPHKAPGPDQIPSTLCRSGAVALAPHIHSMILKSFLYGIEPFPHKGGKLCALFKHKGSRDDATGYRGILLADSFAKITHAWARQRLLPAMQAGKTIGQLGGLPSQQTLTGIQILRVHGKVCKTAKLSTCVLFLDLRSAFHHLLRELVFLHPDGLRESDLRCIFDDNHFDIERLLTRLQEINASSLADPHVPPGLRQFLHDIHHQTWFQLQGSDAHSPSQCTHTRRGSRPGSPIADIAFNKMMSGLLQDLQSESMHMDEYTQGCELLGVYTPPIAWVDDVAIPLATTSPSALIPLVKQVLRTVHLLFCDRGLTLSLDRGKTEAVLNFRGPGSDGLRTQLFDRDHPPTLVVETEHHILSLRVVPSYKHLGAQFTMNIDMEKEIFARLGSARQAFEEMKAQIFLHSLILSRLLYGCAIWTDVSNSTLKKLESTLTGYYRRIYDVGFWKADHLTDDTFLRSNQLPSFRIIWARHRLIYLQHIAQHGAVFHKALLHLERLTQSGWLVELQDDLDWLQRLHPLPFDLPHDRHEWVHAWEVLRSCKTWKSWIKLACKKHALQEKLAWEVSSLHDGVLAGLQSAGLQLLPDCDPPPEPHLSCRHCDAHFTTHQRRALHEFRIHKIHAAERYLVQSTICGGCLKDFHTTFRVVQHLRHRPNRCWSRLDGVKTPAEPVHINLPAHQQGVVRFPAIRRHHGPLRSTPHHRERLRIRTAIQQLTQEGEPDFAWWDPRTQPALYHRCSLHFEEGLRRWASQDAPTVVDFHNIYFAIFFDIEMPEFQIARIFIQWIETDFQDLHCAFDPELHSILEEAHMTLLDDLHIWQLRKRMDHLQQIWTRLEAGEPEPPRVQPSAPQPCSRRHAVISTFARMAIDEEKRRQWTILQVPHQLPGASGTPRYIVHLYSGRRREGDFHFHMQAILHDHQVATNSILILSIDTAIHEKMNIHSPDLWHFLEMIANAGQILALLLGPPCETWSSARFEIQYDDKGRPLR